MQQKQQRPAALFSVYAPSDMQGLERWEVHLRPLEQVDTLIVWSARHLQPGADRLQQLYDHLDQADIIALLLSADFFADDECIALMKRALARHQQGRVRLIPLLLHPVAWRETKLAPLTPLPSDGRAVTLWENPEAAFEDCVRGVRHILGRRTSTALPSSKITAVELSNRKAMLDRVEGIWIKDLLEQSFYKHVQLILGLQEQPHAVTNPWHLLVQEIESSTGPLALDTPIQEIYQQAEGALLILGEPGAGKTTLLLELLRYLLQRARLDETFPIPMVFNLSSWASRQLPLDRWLIEELRNKYQVPHALAQQWLQQQAILPLLDGLDEVLPQARAACVDAINTYRSRSGLTPLVVCCRRAEYDQLITKTQYKLYLRMAVLIQPLTLQQINTFLSDAGSSLSALNQAIQNDALLQELVTTPLMLHVLSLVYQHVPAEDIEIVDVHQIFSQYVQKMLRRRAISSYSMEHMQKWLSSIAHQMTQRGETEFYLEQIQPDWFPHLGVYRWCLGLTFGLIVGLFTFLVYVATFFFYSDLSWEDKIGKPFLLGASTAGAFILLYGVLFNLLGASFTSISPKRIMRRVFAIKDRCNRLFRNPLGYGLLLGSCHEILLVLFGPEPMGSLDKILHALFFGLGYTLIGRVDMAIRPAEALQWSWRNMRANIIKGVGMGLLIGLLSGLAIGPISTLLNAYRFNDEISFAQVLTYQEISSFVAPGLFIAFGSLVFTFIGGISFTGLEKHQYIRPNQGVRNSARNSLFLSLPSGLLIGVITVIFLAAFSSSYDLSYRTGWGIGMGIAVGIVVLLRNGGAVFIQHYLLRFLLWRIDALPWRAIHFLDEAVFRILLYKIGGGYRFIHQLLLAHFSSLTAPSAQDSAFPSHEKPLIDLSPQPSLALSLGKGGWFTWITMIAILVFCSFIAVEGISDYLYRTEIEHGMVANPYPRFFPGHGTIRIYDPLSEPNEWQNSQDGVCQFTDQGYDIHASGEHYCTSQDTFSDFAFSVKATIVQGDCGYIVFGNNEIFMFCSNGDYFYDDIVLGQQPIMKKGLKQPNEVAVVVKGGSVAFFINNQKAGEVPSDLLFNTPIGLGEWSTNLNGSLTEVVYKNAKIWA